MRLFFLFISVLFSFCLTAQTTELSKQNIEFQLKQNLSDSLRVHYLLALSNHIGDQNTYEPKEVNLKALEVLNRMDNTSTHVLQTKALVYDKLGVIERKISNYEKALSNYLKALTIKEQINDSSNIGRSYHNIGMLFRFQKEYIKSRNYLHKAIKLRTKLNDSSRLATSINMYGIIMAKLKKNDSALHYYNWAKSVYKDDLDITSVNANIASLYNKMKLHDAAKPICIDNVVVFKKHNLHYKLCKALTSLAYTYRKTNNLDAAELSITEAEQIAKTNNYRNQLPYIYLQRFKIAREQGKYKDAMNYVVTYNKYKDSIKDIDKAKRITALELNYKHQKEKLADSVRFANEKLSIELRVEAEQSKNRFYITLLLLAITSIISLYLWFNYRKKAAQDLLNKQQLEQELLDERIKNTKFQSQKVMADKSMRLQFTQEFLNKIKHILQRSKEHHNPELQTLISELQSQVKIEKRLEILEENHTNESVDFEKQLIEHFPELTKAEREICALMRLNLSLKDIMSIRNVSIGSIKSSRYRIRKKIDVPKGEELESFIQMLFNK